MAITLAHGSGWAVPYKRELREFSFMGREKLEAASESAQAMAAYMMKLSLELGTRAFNGIGAERAFAR